MSRDIQLQQSSETSRVSDKSLRAPDPSYTQLRPVMHYTRHENSRTHFTRLRRLDKVRHAYETKWRALQDYVTRQTGVFSRSCAANTQNRVHDTNPLHRPLEKTYQMTARNSLTTAIPAPSLLSALRGTSRTERENDVPTQPHQRDRRTTYRAAQLD